MKIIAEIGWNHLGDMNLAKKMIHQAAKLGVDYCKFQTWSVKNLKEGSWDHDGRREIYKKAELSKEQHFELKEYCESNNTKFLTTIFNINDLEFLKKLSPNLIKIGSPEAYNLELIKKCLLNFDKVILSTGATNWKEVEKFKDLHNINKLVLLHCVSSYPCDPNNANMPKMKKLREIVDRVGYSGHCDGVDDAIIAICNGASFVEKHFTLDKNLPGRDNKFAIIPEEMELLCKFRDNYIKMSKDKGLNLQSIEKDVFEFARGRWSKEI